MIWDAAEDRAGGSERISPMQVAHHPLLTAREKLELLHELKLTATADAAAEHGFSAEEIDEAIQEVKLGVQTGQGSDTVLAGDA